MFNLFKKKDLDNKIYAPVDGRCIDLGSVKDKVFAQRLMGDGVAFEFEGENICAPCDGRIVMIAKTLHAFGIQMANGVEILVHIGLDTVNLNGKGLKVLVKQAENVKKGDPIIQVDQAFMKEQKIDLTTPLIITNSNEYQLTISCVGDNISKGEDIVIQCVKKS